MFTKPGTAIDIIKSVSAANVTCWVDGSATSFNPLGANEQTDEEILGSLRYDEIGARVEFIHIERYVLTTYLDGITEKKTHSAPVYTSQKYRVVRIPGETRLWDLRSQYDREIPVHQSLRSVMHIFADEKVAA